METDPIPRSVKGPVHSGLLDVLVDTVKFLEPPNNISARKVLACRFQSPTVGGIPSHRISEQQCS